MQIPQKTHLQLSIQLWLRMVFFIYIPDGVEVEKTFQIVNVIHHDQNICLQTRNLIVLGKNSKLSLIHCDDSYNHQKSLS